MFHRCCGTARLGNAVAWRAESALSTQLPPRSLHSFLPICNFSNYLPSPGSFSLHLWICSYLMFVLVRKAMEEKKWVYLALHKFIFIKSHACRLINTCSWQEKQKREKKRKRKAHFLDGHTKQRTTCKLFRSWPIVRACVSVTWDIISCCTTQQCCSLHIVYCIGISPCSADKVKYCMFYAFSHFHICMHSSVTCIRCCFGPGGVIQWKTKPSAIHSVVNSVAHCISFAFGNLNLLCLCTPHWGGGRGGLRFY